MIGCLHSNHAGIAQMDTYLSGILVLWFVGFTVAHTVDLSTWEAEAGGLLQVQANLTYIVKSRSDAGTQCQPAPKYMRAWTRA